MALIKTVKIPNPQNPQIINFKNTEFPQNNKENFKKQLPINNVYFLSSMHQFSILYKESRGIIKREKQ